MRFRNRASKERDASYGWQPFSFKFKKDQTKKNPLNYGKDRKRSTRQKLQRVQEVAIFILAKDNLGVG